jgi:hypothetical protein
MAIRSDCVGIIKININQLESSNVNKHIGRFYRMHLQRQQDNY